MDNCETLDNGVRKRQPPKPFPQQSYRQGSDTTISTYKPWLREYLKRSVGTSHASVFLFMDNIVVFKKTQQSYKIVSLAVFCLKP